MTTKILDDKEYQRMQGSGRVNETFGKGEYGIRREQNYGLTAHPPKGSIGLVHSLNGNPDGSFSHYLEHPDYRPKNLEEKDMMLYSAHNMEPKGKHSDYAKFTKDSLEISHAKLIVLKVGESEIQITPNAINIKASKIRLVGECYLGVGNVNSTNGVNVYRCDLTCATRVKAV